MTPFGWRPSLARNVALNWTSIAVTTVSTLIVTPIVVRALNKELYGIWSFLNGLLAYSDLLYLGLGAALVKYAAGYFASGNAERLNRLCSVVFSIYCLVGLVSLAAAAAVAPIIPHVFADALTNGTATAARYTCVLLGVRLFSLFVCSAFTGALVAADRTDVARFATIAFTSLRLLLVPVIVRAHSPLIALAALASATAIGETLVVGWLTGRVIPELRLRFVRPQWAELRILYGFGFTSFIVLMAVKLVSYTDQTVIGVMLGAASVALYVLPLQLIEYGRLVIGGMVAVLLPQITVLHMNRNMSALGDAYVRAARVAAALAAFVNVEFIMLGAPFLDRWVGRQFGEGAHVILICLGVSSVLQAVSTQAPLPFFQATGHMRVPAAVLLLEGVANLALSIALVPRFGIDGVAIGTLVPSFFVGFLVLPVYLCRKLDIAPTRLFREAVLSAVGVAAVTAVALGVLNTILVDVSYGVIAAKAAIGALVVGAAIVLVSGGDVRDVLASLSITRTPAAPVAIAIEERA